MSLSELDTDNVTPGDKGAGPLLSSGCFAAAPPPLLARPPLLPPLARPPLPPPLGSSPPSSPSASILLRMPAKHNSLACPSAYVVIEHMSVGDHALRSL